MRQSFTYDRKYNKQAQFSLYSQVCHPQGLCHIYSLRRLQTNWELPILPHRSRFYWHTKICIQHTWRHDGQQNGWHHHTLYTVQHVEPLPHSESALFGQTFLVKIGICKVPVAATVLTLSVGSSDSKPKRVKNPRPLSSDEIRYSLNVNKAAKNRNQWSLQTTTQTTTKLTLMGTRHTTTKLTLVGTCHHTTTKLTLMGTRHATMKRTLMGICHHTTTKLTLMGTNHHT